MKLVLPLWIGIVKELVLFAQRFCDRLRPGRFGLEPFVCVFSIGERQYPFSIGLGASKAMVRIHFKSPKIAFEVFAGLKSIPKAFAEGWMWVEGPVEYSVAVTRFFEEFERIVFPYPLFRHLYRRRPGFSLRRIGMRVMLYVYALFVPFIMLVRRRNDAL